MISLYEEVAVITDQMLVSARTGDWEQLVALETRCSDRVATLKVHAAALPLTVEMREKKINIIKKILADDREIRSITQPWMVHLTELINSSGTERKLLQAYGSSSGS